jgi:hypothetical protein
VSDNVTVKVLLNLDSRCRHRDSWPYRDNSTQYKPGHNLLHAITFESPLGHVGILLHKIWRRLTTDEPDTDWAKQYRRERHRRMWVGDVVVVGEAAFAVDRISKKGPVPRYPSPIWEPVHVEAQQISYKKPNPPPRGVSPKPPGKETKAG